MSKQGTIYGLTGQELARIGQAAARAARRESFALGLPITYVKDGQLVREYPDGHIEPLVETDRAAE